MTKNPYVRLLGLFGGYACCFWAVRLIFLTLIAYSFVLSPEKTQSALQKIGDVARANQALTYGISALVFVLLLNALHPLTRTKISDVFDWKSLRKHFPQNALGGLILTAVLIAGTTLGGHMSFLGIYMKFDEVVLNLSSAALFGSALFLLVLVEEYLFRKVLEPTLSEELGAIQVAVISSLIYVLVKAAQFDLNWIQIINLVLFNLTLSMIAHAEKNYMASASFAGTFLVLIHVTFGLPYMGQDMPGVFLLRGASDDSLGQLLSGGNNGPEAGIVLTVLLVIYLYIPQIRSKKIEV